MTRKALFALGLTAGAFLGLASVWTPPADAAPVQEETTTTTEAPVTTTTEAPVTTTTEAPVTTTTALDNEACFIAGQTGAVAPSPEPSCGVSWASGRQTNAYLQDQNERDNWYGRPMMVGAILVVFFGAVRVVSGFRR